MSIPSLASYTLPEPKNLPNNKVSWRVEPSKAVLLIHDMQKYFVRFYGEDSELIKELQNNIFELKQWAKENEVPVIYTAQPTEQSSEDRALLNDMWGPGLTTEDPSLQDVLPKIAPEENDTVLVKWRYSAFQRSNLQHLMNDQERDQLVVCGIYAHIGCLATSLEAFMLDIKPFMVADAVADFTREEHEMALKYVATRCGSVVSLNEVLGTQTTINLTKGLLKKTLAHLVDEAPEDFDEEENLIDYGLDSIQVMTLISEWEKQGIRLNFEDLAEEPTLAAWWSLIEKQINTDLRKAS